MELSEDQHQGRDRIGPEDEAMQEREFEAAQDEREAGLIRELPSEADMVDLVAAYARTKYPADNQGQDSLDDCREDLDGCYITKIPHYISGGPGYVGPVFVVVWDSEPGHVSVAFQRHGKPGLKMEHHGPDVCHDEDGL